MDTFKNSCLSCLKPLAQEQTHCDECDYINIKTTNSDDRLLLQYFKYLDSINIDLYAIRYDKLQGKSNYDFDVPLEFLDDAKTSARLLEHYISLNFPDLIKSNNFMGIGFNADNKSFDTKSINTIKKNVFQPIVNKIKEVFQSSTQLDTEYNLIKPFVYLSDLFYQKVQIYKLEHTFKLISDATYRQEYENYLKSDALEVNGVAKSMVRHEVLTVISNKSFFSDLRHLSWFIYQLEMAIGNRAYYNNISELVTEDKGVLFTKVYKNAFFNEKMVQLLSYKTHFPALNYYATKNFRNLLSIRTIAETLRGCEGKLPQLDPWIYLACEEVGIQTSIVFNESTTTSISNEFAISLSLALDGTIPPEHKLKVIENEKYINLHWLIKEEKIERNYAILETPKLSNYCFEVIQDLIFSLKMELENDPKMLFSQRTKSNLFTHFIAENNPNRRLFKRNENKAKPLQFKIMRLLFKIANHNEFENLLPMVKEPLIATYYIDIIIALIWKRPYVHIDGDLLQLIDNLGEGKLSKFIAGGPNSASRMKDIIELIIEDSANVYVMKSLSEKRIDIRAVNRFSMIIGKNNEGK